MNNTLNNNFRGIDNAICTLGYNVAQLANGLSAQFAQCCCDIKGGIKDVQYANALGVNQLDRSIYATGNSLQAQISACCCDLEKANMQNRFDMQAYNCNTLNAIDKVGDRVIDYLANSEREKLQQENFALRLAASQAQQNAYLISQLGTKCPEPAYLVPNPNCCYQPVSFNNCGCNGNGGF